MIEAMTIDQSLSRPRAIDILKCNILKHEICSQKIEAISINVRAYSLVNIHSHLVLKLLKAGLLHLIILLQEKKVLLSTIWS